MKSEESASWDGSEEGRVKSEESASWDVPSWDVPSWDIPSWDVPLRLAASGDSMCSCSPLILTVAARSAM